MAIDSGEVRRIAALAHLELDPDTIETLCGQLRSILEYVALLDELDVSSVPPTSYSTEKLQRLRDDDVRGGLQVEQALENAPSTAADHFRVPRVLDG